MRKADKQKEFPKGLLQFALAMGSNQLYGAVSQVNVKPEFGLPGDAIIDSDAAILPQHQWQRSRHFFCIRDSFCC